MINQDDIKAFGNMRKQLAPLLNEDNSSLLERIEVVLGGTSLPASPITPVKKKKRLTHAERVAKYLTPNKQIYRSQ